MSPGTIICWPISCGLPVIVAVALVLDASDLLIMVFTFAPNPLSINSVWFLDKTGSVTEVSPSQYNPASNTQDFT